MAHYCCYSHDFFVVAHHRSQLGETQSGKEELHDRSTHERTNEKDISVSQSVSATGILHHTYVGTLTFSEIRGRGHLGRVCRSCLQLCFLLSS